MNSKFFKVAFVAVMAIIATTMTSCGSSKMVAVSVTDAKQMEDRTGMPAEVEIVFPCSDLDSDVDFLRVNAQGKSKERAMAKDRANQNALANLASKLTGVMAMENKKVAVSTNADGEDFHDKIVTISKLIAKSQVGGYRTACEKYTVNTTDGTYNCYVTIELGKQKIVKELYDNLKSENLLRADYDFDKYLKDFEDDLEKYENEQK